MKRPGYWEIRKGALFVRDRMLRAPHGSVKFGYIGAHQKGNLGDDAPFIAARRLLPKSSVLTYGPPVLESLLKGIGRSGPRYLNAVILGGGTLINPIWIEQVRDALAKGIPIWSLGTGVGSCGFEQPWEIDFEEWREPLGEFQGIGVRGPRSKKALEGLGVQDIKVIGDLGLSLAQDRPHRAADRPRLGMNVTVPEGRRAGDYSTLRQISVFAHRLADAGWEMAPIVLHPWDAEPTREVLSGLPVDPNGFAPARDLEQLWNQLGSCTLTVAGRLHAAVLSSCVGVPPIKIVYREKCLDFMDSMDLSDWCVRLESEDETSAIETANRALDRAPEIREAVWARAREWKEITEAYVKEMIERAG